MVNRLLLSRLLTLVALTLVVLLLGAGAAAAQDAPTAPTAVRVRIAHLAPFAGSDSATIAVQIDGAAVGGTLGYGDHTAYLNLAGAAGPRSVQVLRDGVAVLTQSVTLADGDSSLIITGDDDQIDLGLLALDDNLAAPGAGQTGLRVTHVAVMGATIEATQVDVCSQTGQSFHSSAEGLRYNRSTAYRLIDADTYDLKVTRFVEDNPCTGVVVIDPPPITLAEGAETTLFLVGDGPNQPLAAFTFEEGLIGDDSPADSSLNLPVVFAN